MAPKRKKPKGKSKMGRAKPSHQALGEAVAAIREEKDLTQAQVAKKTGLHVTYISGIETGQRNPTWTVLSQIAQALGLTISELAKRAEKQ